MVFRILISISFLLSPFLFPWFVTVLFGMGLIILTAGHEVVFGGMILDLLYSSEHMEYLTVPFFFTLAFGALYVVSFYAKKRLVFY